MRVWSRKRLLYANCRFAGSVFDKAVGLMFAKRVAPILFDFGAAAARRNSIHSFFCPQFDAVFLDAGKRVVEVRARVRPWSLVSPKKPARFLLELPAGDAARKKIRVGAFLGWANAGLGDEPRRRVQDRGKNRFERERGTRS